MDADICITRGTTERGVPYTEMLIDIGDEITVRRYPKNTYVAIEQIETINGGADINGIFSMGGVIARVPNSQFVLVDALEKARSMYRLDLSDADIQDAAVMWANQK